MLSKQVLALIFLLLAEVQRDYTSIQVIDGIENPVGYKSATLMWDLAGSIGRALSDMNVVNEYEPARYLMDLAGSMDKLEPDDEFGTIDTKFNEISVRIYKKKTSTNKMSKPVMMFYHGGSFSFGNLDSYDHMLRKYVDSLDIVVVSVDYRRSPEYSYPTPADDCWSATRYVIENARTLGVDENRLVLAGDSSGGTIAFVVGQKFLSENMPVKPKIQMLFYPWTQLAHMRLPSISKYESGLLRTFSWPKMILWYLGYKNVTVEMETALMTNSPFALISKQQREKIENQYLNVDLIDDEFKNGHDYYADYGSLRSTNFPTSLSDSSLLARDDTFAKRVQSIFEPSASPMFVDDVQLSKITWKTYMLVCEMDAFKDENLILAKRLEQAGVDVKLAYYDKCFHGSLTLLNAIESIKLPHTMNNNAIEYIRKNL